MDLERRKQGVKGFFVLKGEFGLCLRRRGGVTVVGCWNRFDGHSSGYKFIKDLRS